MQKFLLASISQLETHDKVLLLASCLFFARDNCYQRVGRRQTFVVVMIVISVSYLQALQCLSKLLDELARCDTINLMYAVTNTNHILINTDGRVHRNTFMSTTSSNNTKSNILSGTSSRERAVSENKVIILEYFLTKIIFIQSQMLQCGLKYCSKPADPLVEVGRRPSVRVSVISETFLFIYICTLFLLRCRHETVKIS